GLRGAHHVRPGMGGEVGPAAVSLGAVKGILVGAERTTRQPNRPLGYLFAATSLVLSALTGCGSGVNEKGVYQVPMSPAEKNLSHIAAAYEEAYSKLGHGPKDAEELKPFLKEHGDPAELLKSP